MWCYARSGRSLITLLISQTIDSTGKDRFHQIYVIASLRIYQYWIFIIQGFKPVLRCLNTQKRKNYDEIQIIDPPICKIVLKLADPSISFYY